MITISKTRYLYYKSFRGYPIPTTQKKGEVWRYDRKTGNLSWRGRIVRKGFPSPHIHLKLPKSAKRKKR